MYTQCPDCATVFRVSAAMLRAAQGDVRCGVCATTFNALENLSEKPFKPGPPGIPTLMPEDSMTVEELPGSEDIELSTEEPEPAPPPPVAPPPRAPKPVAAKLVEPKVAAAKPAAPKPAVVKPAEPKPAEPPPPAPKLAEPKPAAPKPAAPAPAAPKPTAAKPAPPAPVVAKPAEPKPVTPTPVTPATAAPKPAAPAPAAPKPAAPKAAAEAAPVSTDDKSLEFHGDLADLDRLFVKMPAAEVPHVDSVTIQDEDRERTDEFPILVLDERDEPEEIILETPKEQLDASDPLETPRFVIPDEMRKGLVAEAAARAGLEVDFGDADVKSDVPRWPWTAAVAVLGVLFVAQVVHSQRDQLIRKRGIGPVLAQSYALLGLPFAMPTDLAAFELRQLGAANDASGAGRLLLRASIVNRAGFSQPFPLLRLALQDRFGTTLFVRDIEPGDYLPREGAPRLLASGARADAEIRIVDPGSDAVGFEMDVCLPADGGVYCANQLATAAP